MCEKRSRLLSIKGEKPLFTSCLEEVFSETHIQNRETLSIANWAITLIMLTDFTTAAATSTT